MVPRLGDLRQGAVARAVPPGALHPAIVDVDRMVAPPLPALVVQVGAARVRRAAVDKWKDAGQVEDQVDRLTLAGWRAWEPES